MVTVGWHHVIITHDQKQECWVSPDQQPVVWWEILPKVGPWSPVTRDPEGSDPAGFDPAGLSVKVNTEVLRFSLTSIH